MCEWISTESVFVTALLLQSKYLKSKPHSNVQACVENQYVGDSFKTLLYKVE